MSIDGDVNLTKPSVEAPWHHVQHNTEVKTSDEIEIVHMENDDTIVKWSREKGDKVYAEDKAEEWASSAMLKYASFHPWYCQSCLCLEGGAVCFLDEGMLFIYT